jgi:hypothetical protein
LYVFLCTFFLIKKYQKIKAGLCFSALCPIPDCRQAGMHFIDKPSKLPCVKCNGLAIHAIPLRASQLVSPQAMAWPTRLNQQN